MYLKETECADVDWIRLSQQCPFAGCCEDDDETSGSKDDGKFRFSRKTLLRGLGRFCICCSYINAIGKKEYVLL
jgi:hypothetical protein